MWETIFDDVSSWYRRHIDTDSTAFCSIGQPRAFPEPRGLNINMMPIKMFRLEQTLPESCRGYIPFIRSCLVPRTHDRTVYLTIHESRVPAGEAQRRPGLHVERPGQVADGGRYVRYDPLTPLGEYRDLAWGLGYCERDGLPADGIYMASNVARSSRVYPAIIRTPGEVTDEHGGIEHMRGHLGEGHDLEANQLCWITDRTPHESLPVPDQVYRQLYRPHLGVVLEAQHAQPARGAARRAHLGP